MAERNTSERPILNATTKRGMVLPFRPLSLAFNHVNYYINMPAVSSALFFTDLFSYQGETSLLIIHFRLL
jgi:hypothetical protein